MKQNSRLVKNYEFSRVYQKGRRVSGKVLTVHYLKRPNRGLRTGVTVRRRLKGAVRRNRYKRLMRESLRLIRPELKSGYDVIIMGKMREPLPDYETVSQDMLSLFKRAGLWHDRCDGL